MSRPRYFDYASIAQAAGISPADLARLESLARADHPQDDMLFELRLLRTCSAIRDGAATLEQALQPAADDSPQLKTA